jgi:hypothetical protein
VKAPTLAYDNRIAADTSKTLTLFPLLIIGFVAVLCIIVIITVYCRRLTKHMYKIAEVDFQDDEGDVLFRFDEESAPAPTENSIPMSRSSLVNVVRKSTSVELHRVDQRSSEDRERDRRKDKEKQRNREGDRDRGADRRDRGSPPSNKVVEVVESISHNARMLFNRPKSLSLEGIGSMQASTPRVASSDDPEDRRKCGWFEQDAVNFDQHDEDGEEEMDYSLHVRQPYPSSKRRSRDDRDEKDSSTYKPCSDDGGSGKKSDGDNFETPSPDDLIDTFVNMMKTESSYAMANTELVEQYDVLRIDLDAVEVDDNDDGVHRTQSDESTNTTESTSNAIDVVSTIFRTDSQYSRTSSFGKGNTPL